MKSENRKLDDLKGIQVTEGIHWVGFADFESGFSNNPYLLIDEEEAILFDPGPGHPLFKELITQKIQNILPMEKIKYIVVHHQDPDLCALIPYIEYIINPDAVIIAHPRAALFLPYYGIRKKILPVGDRDILELESGRKIIFYHTPYAHFAGSMMSYDTKTKTLFSSDIFGTFNRNWSFKAKPEDKPLMQSFLEHYVEEKGCLKYIYDFLKELSIDRICPQHGSVIADNVEDYLRVLVEAEPGQMLKELKTTPSKEGTAELIKTGIEWLKYWLKKPVTAGSLKELLGFALKEGPATVSLLLDSISRKAQEMGISNPLAGNTVHQWKDLQATRSENLLYSIREKLLKSQYSMLYGNETNIDVLLNKRLQAVKMRLNIMFVDIRGFTSWSQNIPADEIIRTLNEEIELICRIITRNFGRVNKIIGDGVLAYFPESLVPHSLFATSQINAEIRKRRLLQVGTGMSYGEVIMGDIGEDIRLDFTIIGKTVNMASRLCSLAAKGQVGITLPYFMNLPEDIQSKIKSLESYKQETIRVKKNDPRIETIVFDSFTFA
ncbi:MAG: hypothetical protein JW969_15470 [Spirochaetales bacterium]|nr:hypothetical protein [Spirochaetales bacterium]